MKRVITVEDFYKERDEWRVMVGMSKSPDDVVHDPGDDIICDRCNGDGHNAELGTVTIVDNYVVCPECENT